MAGGWWRLTRTCSFCWRRSPRRRRWRGLRGWGGGAGLWGFGGGGVGGGFGAAWGVPAVDLQALAAMLVTLGQWFVQQQGAFSSIDPNPVLVSRTAAPVLVDTVVIPCAGARAGRIRSH